MLPLHKNFKYVAFALYSLIVFTSCANKSKIDIEVLKVLNEGLVSSNKMISASTMEVMVVLKNKLHEPGSEERAKVWYPKAEQIQRLSKDIFDYIERVKQNIYDTVLNNSELFKKLKNYQAQLLHIDPKITHQFQPSLKIYTQLVDSSTVDQEKFFHAYFKGASTEAVIALLTKIQNNIKLNEVRMVTFCNEHVGSIDGHGFATSISVVSIINSSVVQPGDDIEILSGVGEFNTFHKPEVFVYGKLVPIDESGVAVSKLKAATKPGKYYVPINIQYTDQDGKQQTIQKEIEYTVANIQKQ